MINKANEDDQTPDEPIDDNDGFIDIARMDVQCHLLIKDKDTGEVIINKRG